MRKWRVPIRSISPVCFLLWRSLRLRRNKEHLTSWLQGRNSGIVKSNSGKCVRQLVADKRRYSPLSTYCPGSGPRIDGAVSSDFNFLISVWSDSDLENAPKVQPTERSGECGPGHSAVIKNINWRTQHRHHTVTTQSTVEHYQDTDTHWGQG